MKRPNTNAIVLAVSILTIFLAGCTQKQHIVIDGNGSLDITGDVSPFVDAGCINTGNWVLDCSSSPQLSGFSCDPMRAADGLGGLSPNVPIAECEFMDRAWIEGTEPGIIRTGCMAPFFRSYVIVEDGAFRQISSKEEFVKSFAPVETPEEALGFAIALTKAFPIYEPDIPIGFKVFADEIRGTYAEETDAGFKVHLFYSEYCGCGNHPVYAVDYLVTRDGQVSQSSMEKMFEDPKLAGLCVD